MLKSNHKYKNNSKLENNLCIIGGGNIAKSFLFETNFKSISLLSVGSHEINRNIFILNGKKKKFNNVYNYYGNFLKKYNLIIITSPSDQYPVILKKIKRFLNKSTYIGNVAGGGGFFWLINKIIPKHNKFFTFERAPFISRYENKKFLHFKKKFYRIAFTDENVFKILKKNIKVNAFKLNSFLETEIISSNYLYHLVLIYVISLRRKKSIYFYKNLRKKDLKIFKKIDFDLNKIMHSYSKYLQNNLKYISYNEHFGSDDQKVYNIFTKGDLSKIKISPNDLTSEGRFYREDFQNGIILVKQLAEFVKCKTPSLDKMIRFHQKKFHVSYIDKKNKLILKNLKKTNLPSNFGYSNKSLFNLLKKLLYTIY